MATERRYPRFQDDREFKYEGWSHAILVTWAEGQEPQRFCGHSHCSGTCGLPALTLPPRYKEPYKARDSSVAAGPVFYVTGVKWCGEVVEVPEEYREACYRLMWW